MQKLPPGFEPGTHWLVWPECFCHKVKLWKHVKNLKQIPPPFSAKVLKVNRARNFSKKVFGAKNVWPNSVFSKNY